MDRYHETKQILNDMASVKMSMNSHKGVIEDCDREMIMTALCDEVHELKKALEGNSLMSVIEEAADVQNFLVALVQQQVSQYRSRKDRMGE